MRDDIMTCIIVDDEYVSRCGIKSYVDKIPGLECAGVASDVDGLRELLDRGMPDIIFLDIEMPGESGIEFLEQASLPCAVVIITAYERYALRGYDLSVTDYLLKPVSFSRFSAAVGKVRAFMASAMSGGVVTLRSDKAVYRIPVEDILYVEAMENYLKVHTSCETIVVRMTLKAVCSLLPADRFIKIHRSYIVNIGRVVKAEMSEVTIFNGDVLPLSKSCRKQFLATLAPRNI